MGTHMSGIASPAITEPSRNATIPWITDFWMHHRFQALRRKGEQMVGFDEFRAPCS